jgi:uncharacterized coiled-coil protein SlyX
VAGVNPDLITRDSVGKPETVRYDQVNAMLLNEEAAIARQQRQIELITVGLQKVNAQLEASNATTR